MLKKIIIGLLGVVLVLILGVFLFAKDIEIHVSEREAQTAIETYLSTAGDHKAGYIVVRPNHLSVDFKAGNKAEVSVDVDLKGLGYSGQFAGRFSSGIKYRNPRLYLNGIELLDGGFSTDEETQAELDDLKKVSADILRRQRANEHSQDTDAAVDNSREKNTEIVEKFAQEATRAFFEFIPIYNISGDSFVSKVASLALKDVRFTEDEAIITLSPVTALLRILTMMLMALLLFLYLFSRPLMKYSLAKLKNDNKSS